LEADMFALRVMRDCGFSLFNGDIEAYRKVLKVIDGE